MTVGKRRILTAVVLFGFIAVVTVACAPDARPAAPTDLPTPAPAATALAQPLTPSPAAATTPTPIPTESWLVVLQKTPYPYTTPLPPETPTALDGIYVKFEPKEGTPVPCRRCPDYLPEGGIWRLNLDRGIYRIFHEGTGWFSMGSFTVSDDQMMIFNDPTCIHAVGVYEWELTEGGLLLAAIEDACQVNRRGRSFATLAWTPCHPPNTEAAVTDHWPRPADCAAGE